MKKLFLLLAAVIALSPLFIHAKSISGLVKSVDGKLLSNIVLKVRGTKLQISTNGQGLFQLDLPLGNYTFDIEGGYGAHFHQEIQVTNTMQLPLLLTLQDEADHKIVVTANPLEHTTLDMATPVIVLAGEELVMKRANTLGEILQFEPGLSVSSFGPAVSRPVIRGLGGARVQISNNQMIVQDASSTSVDHDVGIEPLLANQIEVVKGPATLLYGSGAIGGVVNTSDKKINSALQDDISGGMEVRLGNSATQERSLVFALDGSSESFNWHIDGYSNQSDDLKIPGHAESEILHQAEAENTANPIEEDEEDLGRLDNSHLKTQGGSLGTTYVADWGYVGAAVSQIDKTYGVPGHMQHSQSELLPVVDESVQIDMTQTRYDLQAQIDQPFITSKLIEKWFVGYASTDYQHVELEGIEVGTEFNNKAWELKSYLKHKDWQGWLGVLGVQFSKRDFTAIGDEAFVMPSKTETHALFVLEEKHFGDLKWELGFRFEQQTIKADGESDLEHSGVSFSSGLVYSLASHNKLAVNFSRALRFASVEEFFSNGPHIATQSYEIGNSQLKQEISNNFDFSYRFENGNLNGEINLFLNQFDGFIYGENVLADAPCVSINAATEAELNNLNLVCYQQQDADFYGAEFQFDYFLGQWQSHEFKLGFFSDYLQAQLDDDEYVPRIPPPKFGLILSHDWLDFSSQLSWTHTKRQNHLAQNELATEAFDIMDLELAYRTPYQKSDLFLFFKAKNILDEEARDHASFLKDLAPRVGRNFLLGARFTF